MRKSFQTARNIRFQLVGTHWESTHKIKYMHLKYYYIYTFIKKQLQI